MEEKHGHDFSPTSLPTVKEEGDRSGCWFWEEALCGPPSIMRMLWSAYICIAGQKTQLTVERLRKKGHQCWRWLSVFSHRSNVPCSAEKGWLLHSCVCVCWSWVNGVIVNCNKGDVSLWWSWILHLCVRVCIHKRTILCILTFGCAESYHAELNWVSNIISKALCCAKPGLIWIISEVRPKRARVCVFVCISAVSLTVLIFLSRD